MARVGIRLSFLLGFAACYSSTGGEPADGDRDSAEEIRGDIVVDDGRDTESPVDGHDGEAEIVPDDGLLDEGVSDDGLLDEGIPDAAPWCGDGYVWRGHEECDGDPPRPCATDCGSTGAEECTETCRWSGVCTPPPETCNGADDDCDTEVDEGFECLSGTSRSCTTTCGSEGRQACDAGCRWGPCDPPEETCNCADDDCDGWVDDTCLCSPVGHRTLDRCVPWGPPGVPPGCTSWMIDDAVCLEAWASRYCTEIPVVDLATETVVFLDVSMCSGCYGDAWVALALVCDGPMLNICADGWCEGPCDMLIERHIAVVVSARAVGCMMLESYPYCVW